jgi:hypothetical protein
MFWNNNAAIHTPMGIKNSLPRNSSVFMFYLLVDKQSWF